MIFNNWRLCPRDRKDFGTPAPPLERVISLMGVIGNWLGRGFGIGGGGGVLRGEGIDRRGWGFSFWPQGSPGRIRRGRG